MPLIVVCAAWGVFWGSWAALLPAVKDQLGTSTAGLGLALFTVPVGAIPAMALTGRLARGRERTALALSTAAFALSILAAAPASTPLTLGLALLLVGACSGALDVALNMATGRAERESGRRLFQPVHAAFPVAVIVAAPATGLVRELGLGIPAVLGAISVLVLAAALSLARLPMGAEPPPPPPPGKAARRRDGLALGALAACVLIIENAVEQWSVLLLEEHRGAGTVLAGTAPAAYMLSLTAGRLIVQAAPRITAATLHLVAALGGGGGIALAGLAPTSWLSLAGFSLTGLALGPLVPAMLSRAAAADPQGRLVSAVSTVSYTGFVVSPLLVAALSAWLTLPWALAALGLLAVPLLIPLIGRSR
ncbi:MFS transporter [Thermoactinospora rubra]|uniref:MFS transporter n=1 Tax=Thermoactinospora rubra TaxID=1088767 RepID=UPI000A110FBA|nr:MFS transporter [Thermoactinospora rubra]